VTTTVSSAAPVASRRRTLLPGLGRASVLYLLALILVIFGLWIPDTFLSQATFKIVLGDQVVIGILGLGLLVPLSAGAFDLSCGAMLAFSLVIMSWFQSETGVNAVFSALIALAACAVVGFLSGLLVVKFRVNSFIATLGMSQVLAAATLWISKNRQIVGVFSERFLDVGRRDLLGLPIVVFYLLAIALIIWYVIEWTPLGRHLLATGANPEAARLAGVRTDRMVWGSLIVSAVVSGLAGIIYGAKVGSFSNTFGPPLLFPAFAAVFFGSTQFKNRPNVWGTIAAVYTLAFGVKGLQLAFSGGVYWITPLFNGLALLVAVALASRKTIPKLRPKAVAEAAAATEALPTSTEAAPDAAVTDPSDLDQHLRSPIGSPGGNP
jgi:ribose transport system permease protein